MNVKAMTRTTNFFLDFFYIIDVFSEPPYMSLYGMHICQYGCQKKREDLIYAEQ